MLPVLHLNGYKIANPTVLARIPERELSALFEGYGWRPVLVTGGFDGEDPALVHQRFAAALDEALDEIREIQRRAREHDEELTRPRWPMLILRTPKGWTGPKEVDGKKTEDSWRSHQVPMPAVRDSQAHLRQLEEWLRSYRPEELFDDDGRLVPELAALAPAGERRMSANPHANGGALMRDLVLPDFRDYAVEVSSPRDEHERGDTRARRLPARRHRCETRTTSGSSARTRRRSNRLGDVFDGHRPDVARRDEAGRRTALAPMDGSWRSSPSTSAKGGSRAISSPVGTDSSTATRRSSTSSTRCSTSTPSG